MSGRAEPQIPGPRPIYSSSANPSRCPPGYYGLSCETCSPGFERVPGGAYLGTCAGCNCNGHASACDPVNGHCLVGPAPKHSQAAFPPAPRCRL